MKYEITHTNIFEYENDVDQSMNHIRLKPSTDECQHLLSYQIDITPPSMTKESIDLWGNTVESFLIPQKHRSLEVKTTSVVSIQRAPFIERIEYSSEMKSIFHSRRFKEHYLPFLKENTYTFLSPEQVEEMTQSVGNIENPVQFPLELMQYLHKTFTYDTEATNVHTTAQEAFALKKGVCQDYTHVMLGMLRKKGIPARYVSGYLYTGDNAEFIGDSASHAWVEVMVPGIGWIGLDPTNNVEALENHIRIGIGRDYTDVSPLQGIYRGGSQTLEVKSKCEKTGVSLTHKKGVPQKSTPMTLE